MFVQTLILFVVPTPPFYLSIVDVTMHFTKKKKTYFFLFSKLWSYFF